MPDSILIDSDTVTFLPNFGAATVFVRPGIIKGSAKALLNGQKVCIEGDEKSVEVPGCLYIKPPHSIPGVGTIKIKSLKNDQKSKILVVDGKPVLLKGTLFTAVFSIEVKALTPPPSSTPDSATEYEGQGQFLNKNRQWLSS